MTKRNPELQREIDARANRAGTKQWIVEAATFEFANYGLDGARIDRIAKSAKINKAMIYYHFESKDHLYLEVVISFFKRIGQRGAETVLSAESLEEALLALADLHESMFTDNEYVRSGAMTVSILRELADPRPEVLETIVGVFASAGIPQRIAALMSEGIGRGEYQQVDVRQALVAFASMSLYYPIVAPFINKLLSIEDPRRFSADRKRAIVDIFLNGLKVRPA